MNFAFDHVVHYVENSELVIDFLGKKSIHAQKGGIHKDRPTHNVLSHFDLSYIEYLEISDKKKLEGMNHSKHSMINTIIKNRYEEGFARCVISTNQIEEVGYLFRKKGMDVEGPIYLSREQPDGGLLEWKLLFIGDNNGGLELPYFIQWGSNDEDRRRDLIVKELIVNDPSQPTFSHITFAVHDLKETFDKWSSLFELKGGEVYLDKQLKARCQRLRLKGGDLVFASPIEDGVVSQILKRHGEKPIQIDFLDQKKDDFFELFGGYYNIKKY